MTDWTDGKQHAARDRDRDRAIVDALSNIVTDGTGWDNYQEQTISVLLQLTVIDGLNGHQRRKFRLLEYVCTRCQSTILEVIQTNRGAS